ncbi:hypothetical protein [Mangrovibacterium diazotrophicum]|uniref:Alginate export protein n=1 Tax=Mangrovibacterium diazotrophicum TaxID=1261403 RepID=A0A419VUX4_9BACT|nr:hypothetical protein [Mangrovibacterium diazotrophicum]RKD85969.1 hypothetical protein BC643_4285 [Mangrovibacterium diazotrophicum]
MSKIKTIIIALLCFWTSHSFAQWECRSHLASNLKPLYENSNLSWAAELEASGGYLTNSYIGNGMAFLGADLTFNRVQFYAEGAYKYWYNQDLDLDETFTKSRFGLRELSASYFSNNFNLRLGLHQIQAGDFFLLNERALGASFNYSASNTKLVLATGTVTKDFSRNGIFCSTAYIYDIVPTRTPTAGTDFGETNFATLSFQKDLSHKPTKASSSSEDEFETFDEFTDFDESSKSNPFGFASYGGIIYSEFGSFYDNPLIDFGLNTAINLGPIGTAKAEGIYQLGNDNKAWILFAQLEKEFQSKSGNLTTLQATYLTKHDIGESTASLPRFSNLILGEVFRMDLVDLPLINASLKQQFTNSELSFKLQYTQQLKAEQLKELDFSVGKFYLKKHLRLTAITGVMNSDDLNEWAKLARLEMRVFF